MELKTQDSDGKETLNVDTNATHLHSVLETIHYLKRYITTIVTATTRATKRSRIVVLTLLKLVVNRKKTNTKKLAAIVEVFGSGRLEPYWLQSLPRLLPVWTFCNLDDSKLQQELGFRWDQNQMWKCCSSKIFLPCRRLFTSCREKWIYVQK